tara:strand:+ start:1250 stop:1516 length:267 start_codon:yes stop_codon:yes gene_type:complete
MNKNKHYWDLNRNGRFDEKESSTPEYYIGKNGLEAIDVIHQFNLSYDLGSACSYILRAKRKHKDGGKECILKAIHHLKYELRKLESNE